MYIAIVLTDESKDKLKEKYRVPWGWEDIYHHVTIVMGNKMNDFPFSIGEKVVIFNVVSKTFDVDWFYIFWRTDPFKLNLTLLNYLIWSKSANY